MVEIVRNCLKFVVEFLGLEYVLIRCLHCVDTSKKQGDAAQLKKEGDKKKAKTTMTWHFIECEGTR